ncbi:MAG: hypothetical protein HKN30_12800 [Sulfitobacter sp.]|nr:hypothetical protein [Sulfitobacter sp.]
MIPRACAVPRDALLSRYVAQEGVYTDCFEVMHPGPVDLPAMIEAFYTTGLFRIERLVLSVGLRRRITVRQVQALAQGGASAFAAWEVEAREESQILLRDLSGATRSWLAAAPKEGAATRLLFGSAVVPRQGRTLGPGFRLLVPLHRAYARALLRAAEWRLRRG